ncbi:heterokaryon incompatibility protein-domain-containing protein [Xylaria curta]|nr:heterokaryon incompatibility protein-domain-containing protein [Xylaria curta]
MDDDYSSDLIEVDNDNILEFSEALDDAIPEATFCEICAPIFSENSYERWSKFWQIWGQIHNGPPDKYYLPYPGRHHQSLQSLRDSLDRCCYICSQPNIRCSDESHMFPFKYRLRKLAEFEKQLVKGTYELIIKTRGRNTLSLYVRPSSPLLTLQHKSKCRIWTGHNGAARVVKDLVRECLMNHDLCSKSFLSRWKPSRLLDVSEDRIKLVSGKSEEARQHPYITLSHCWGIQPFSVLTVTTMPVYIEGIDISEFDLTFRETIITIRRLGVRYLWIDCHCIIQGPEDEAVADWNHESPRMGKVYANSLLNIGALDSTCPADGLFRIRRSGGFDGRILWSSTRRDGRKLFYITYLTRDYEVMNAFRTLQGSVLMKRGWVLQECVLAPRMLSFGDGEIFWQCAQVAACEGQANGILFHLDEWTRGRLGPFPFWLLRNPSVSYRPRIQEIKLQWMSALTAYCRSHLTYPEKDLFVALEGVGAELSKISKGSRFRYGIWDLTLPEALIYGTDRHKYKDVVLSKRNKARPTWHWSSCYPEVSIGMGEGQLFRLAYAFMSDDCQPLSNEFSRDFWPNMLLIGRLISARPTLHEYFDTQQDEHASYSQELFYLPLTFKPNYFIGLILAQARPGAYCRRGTWQSGESYLSSVIVNARPQLIILE